MGARPFLPENIKVQAAAHGFKLTRDCFYLSDYSMTFDQTYEGVEFRVSRRHGAAVFVIGEEQVRVFNWTDFWRAAERYFEYEFEKHVAAAGRRAVMSRMCRVA
jgi:hypothetical protein